MCAQMCKCARARCGTGCVCAHVQACVFMLMFCLNEISIYVENVFFKRGYLVNNNKKNSTKQHTTTGNSSTKPHNKMYLLIVKLAFWDKNIRKI